MPIMSCVNPSRHPDTPESTRNSSQQCQVGDLGTLIGPVKDGRHVIRLEFTAKNAFGGRVRHTAAGYVDNKTCEATLVDIY